MSGPRATVGSTIDGGGGQTNGALPRLQGGVAGFGGLIGLVQQALAHQIVDDGHVGEGLAKLDSAVWPGPQTLPI